MAELKTKQTEASVRAYLDAIADDQRRADCEILMALMSRASGYEAKMWGPSIVGFGSYHYKYASGHEGDACLVGFASRKGDISLHIACGFNGSEPLLDKLGKHKGGKACLYIKRSADIDLQVLEELVRRSVEEMKRGYH
jgi:hypothetical protein